MRKSAFLAFLLVALCAVSRPVPASDTLVCVNLDWMLSVRGGIEHRFHPHLGVKGDLGVSLMGLVAADAFLVVYILPPESSWRLNLLLGVPNTAVPMTFNAAMVSFGGSILFGFHLTDSVLMDIRPTPFWPMVSARREGLS